MQRLTRNALSVPQTLKRFAALLPSLLCATVLSGCTQPADTAPAEQSTSSDNQPQLLNSPAVLAQQPYVDLSNDSLVAPNQPQLSISAEPGNLHLKWTGIADQINATLWRYDNRTGLEKIVGHYPAPHTNNITLDSRTHITAWHAQQFRVALCTRDACVSSQRVATTHLAPQTTTQLTPAVVVEGERFASHVALNQNATLLVSALPVQGALDMYFRVANNWTRADRIGLAGLTLSSTRQLYVALSASGDTLAVLVSEQATHGAGHVNNTLRILERLGETWIETSTLSLRETGSLLTRVSPSSTVPKRPPSLIMSAEGDTVIVGIADTLSVIERTQINWSVTSQLPLLRHLPGATDSATINSVGAGASSNADRLYTLATKDNQLWLTRWHRFTQPTSAQWVISGTHRIHGIDTQRGAQIAVSADGNTLGIAGWELTSGGQSSPVFWRFMMADSADFNAGTDSTQITISDSLRMAPVTHSKATLSLAADSTLTTIALSWQANDGNYDMRDTDAALTSYTFDAIQARWLPALEIPESIPTLAKQSMGRQLRLSADASTLVLSTAASHSSASQPRTDQIVVLR